MSSDATPPAPSPSASPSPTAGTTAKTVLPSRQLYNKALRRDLMVSIPLLVVLLCTQVVLHLGRSSVTGDPMAGFMVWFMVALVGVGIAVIVVYYVGLLKNTRIGITPDELRITNWAGRVRSVAYTEVATLIQTNVRLPGQVLPMLFLLDSSGRKRLTMYGTLWHTDAMLEVGAATGVAATTFPAPVTFRELRARYPKSVNWARANPIAFASIIAGSVFLLLLVGVAVVFALVL